MAQEFSEDTLLAIKKALVLQLTIARTYGLATYTQDAQDALNAVNKALGRGLPYTD